VPRGSVRLAEDVCTFGCLLEPHAMRLRGNARVGLHDGAISEIGRAGANQTWKRILAAQAGASSTSWWVV
jgi:hypothetical protein